MARGERIADALRTLWREASAPKRALLAGAPVAVLAVAAVGIGFAVSSGGSASAHQVLAPTQAADSATSAPPTITSTPVPTETPASAGLQAGATAPPGASSSGGRRIGPPPAGLSGPGPAVGTSYRLSIPSIGVDAPVNSRTVGQNGQMGNPTGPWDVILYDFSGWPGLGGMPGDPGANAVFAGHVDYIHVGPAVFWSTRDLQPGDHVIVNTPNGPITYAIQWSQWTDPDIDFTQFVQKTGQDSITLVTCIGDFANGHYNHRLVVRGVRI